MGPWTYAVHPWWPPLALVALLLGAAGVSAQASLRGDLETAAPIHTSGGTTWAAGDALLVLKPHEGSTLDIFLDGSTGDLHSWTWNRTRVSNPLVDSQNDVTFEDTSVRLGAVEQLRVRAGPDAAVVMRFREGAAEVGASQADLVRSGSAHAAVDPTYRIPGTGTGVPYVHGLDDALTMTSSGDARVGASGAIQVSVWDAYLEIEGADRARSVQTGQWQTGSPAPSNEPLSILTKRVAWLELNAAAFGFHSDGPLVMHGAHHVVRVDGTVVFPHATGTITSDAMDAHLVGADLQATGTFEVESVADPPAAADGRSAWRLSGSANGIVVNGWAPEPHAPGGIPTGAVIGAGAMLFGWLALRMAPVVLATLTPSDRRLLHNRTRATVFDLVVRAPGVNAAAVAQMAAISRSTAKYHLHILADSGLITPYRDGRSLRYFENHHAWTRDSPIVALLARRRCQKIVQAVVAEPGATQAALADATGLARSTVAFQLQRLRDAGAVRNERQGGHNLNHYHPTMKLHGVLSRLRATTTAPAPATPNEA